MKFTLAALVAGLFATPGTGQHIPTHTELMCTKIIENREKESACEYTYIKRNRYRDFLNHPEFQPEYQPLVDQLTRDFDTMGCRKHFEQNPQLHLACQGAPMMIDASEGLHSVEDVYKKYCPEELIERDLLAICRNGFPEKYNTIYEQYMPYRPR